MKFTQKLRNKFNDLIKATFPIWQSLGVHIVPNHFYEPVPDTRKLNDELWDSKQNVTGIDFNVDKQKELLAIFAREYKSEYDAFPKQPTEIPYEFYLRNGTFETVDCEILYSMVRYHKPPKIIEIGSGFSTFVTAQTIRKNQEIDPDYECEFISIEPFPNDILKGGIPGLSRLIEKDLQEIPISEFTSLGENDILFIDSSHVLTIGSDVHYEYLEIVPQLQKGVIVHVHDIHLPNEYPKEWVFGMRRFWTEQYLLQAFISYNDSFEILWAGSYMAVNYQDLLSSAFASFSEGGTPGSFWFRRVK